MYARKVRWSREHVDWYSRGKDGEYHKVYCDLRGSMDRCTAPCTFKKAPGVCAKVPNHISEAIDFANHAIS